MNTPANDQAKRRTALQMIIQYFRDFKLLKDNPREYWAMQAVNVLDSMGYFALTTAATLFLSSDIGMTDEDAGYVMFAFPAAITVFLMFTGPLTDWLGVRWSLNVAMVTRIATTLGIGLLALGPDFAGRGWLIAILFMLMAPGMAMVQTAFQVGTKRFTSKRSRGASFNLWYLFMNLGGVAAGIAVDLLKVNTGEVTAGGEEIYTWTWVVLLGVATSAVSLLLTMWMIRREQQVVGPGEDPATEISAEDKSKAAKRPLENLKTMLKQSAFWRFIVLVFATLGVRAVYLYMYLLMPKYWVRVIGPDANVGLLSGLNPLLIVFGLILFIPIANRFNLFKMLIFGAMVSASSIFLLVIPWQWVSADPATAYYILSIGSLVLLSIGEVFWSPKLYEYTAAIAPEGQEGTYLGMSMMPWFAAKVVVGAASGHLLTQWCPEGTGEAIRAGTLSFWDSPEAMWLLLGIIAMIGPILAWFARGWLTKGADFEISKGGKKAANEAA